MKYLAATPILILFIFTTSVTLHGQVSAIDSLKAGLLNGVSTTSEVNTLNKLAVAYLINNDCDSGLYYSVRSVKMAEALDYKKGKALATFYTGLSLRCKQDYTNAYTSLLEAKNLFEELGNEKYVAKCLKDIGIILLFQDNKADALRNFFLALNMSEKIKDTTEIMTVLIEISDLFYFEKNYIKALEYAKRDETYAYSQPLIHPREVVTEQLGYIYTSLNNDSLALKYQLESLRLSAMQKDTFGIANSYLQLGYYYYDSKNNYELALQYLQKAEKMYAVVKDSSGISNSHLGQARVYRSSGNAVLALISFKKSLHVAELIHDNYAIADNCIEMGQTLFEAGRYAEALSYFKDNLEVSRLIKQATRIAKAYKEIGNVYEKLNKPGEALIYLNKFILLQDSINTEMQEDNLMAIEVKRNFDKAVYENEIEQERDEFRAGVKIYSLLAVLVVLLLLSFMLYRNIMQKQRAKLKIETAFEELKATQQQLIQSEKMASLGELTAGIAHEIQNPLNFVNNFSEVSNELIDEMKEKFRNGETEEGYAIADDIKQNLEKVIHHGKRADAIVKGMLEHSRTSSGERLESDINVLCDEYLRLSYHGLRAKDKSFNSSFETEFDPELPKINVVPQDIGRVLLNLINNAFYAVNEKSKDGKEGYKPYVKITTRKTEKGIEISVKDNGNGIPEHIKDKIFQPFFTTKPTGQGTGLGLSLSYDIVKAHGGELKVVSKEGEGSEFIINLPV